MIPRLIWWKWLVLLIFPYVIFMGFIIPLGQGISSVNPSNLMANKLNQVSVEGYNTRFTESKKIEAWLKIDEYLLTSTKIEVKSTQSLSIQFDIPKFNHSSDSYLDVSLLLNTVEGPIVFPSAFSLKNQVDSTVYIAGSQWSNTRPEFNAEANFNYPFRSLMGETIRNTFFHVPLWFAMTFLFLWSVYYSIRYLRRRLKDDDLKAKALVSAGVLFGLLGCATGSIWAKYTWGKFWTFDVKLNMAALSLLIYFGYFLLRKAFKDPDSKSRISSIYNIFAFALLIPLIFVIPRMYDSLHPGNGGNPALGGEDLDNTLRVVFYPAIIGYILLGFWLSELVYRTSRLTEIFENK